MSEFTAIQGVRWGRVQHLTGPEGGAATEGAPGPDFVFSLDGPPYLELVRVRLGTVWGELGPHHAAVWCDDLAEAGERVLAAGWMWEHGKYFRSAAGVRHELVPRSTYQPRLRRYLDGGDMFLAGDGPESFEMRHLP
jgi:hypothetical protein